MATHAAAKKCSASIFVVLLVVIGLLIWLLSTVTQIAAVIQCVLDELDQLYNNVPHLENAPDEAADAINGLKESIDVSTLETIEFGATLLPAASITPAALVLVGMLSGLACTYRKEGNGYYCAKCLFFLSSLFLLVGVAFYIVIGFVGTLVDRPEVQETKEGIEAMCGSYIPSLQNTTEWAMDELASTRAEYEEKYGDALTEEAIEDLDNLEWGLEAANFILARFGIMCTCIDGIFDLLRALVAPGFGCAVLFVITFIMTQAQCCMMGCCCSNPVKEKADVKMTDGGEHV